MAKPEKQETTIGKTYNKSQQKRPQRKKDTTIPTKPSKPKSVPFDYQDPRTKEQIKSSLKPKSTIKTNKNFATPGTGFKDTSGTNNQPKTVTSGDRAKEALKKAVKTSVGISPFTAKTKKEKKMYGSPAKMDTVDPTTGQVLPASMGQGPTNVGNANTANTLQAQADAAAVKANRAGAPDRSASSISQTPMTMQGNFRNASMAHASRMFGNVANPVPSPSQFNKGLRKASAQGKLDGNPSFKSKVNAAPIKAKGNPEIKGSVLPEL